MYQPIQIETETSLFRNSIRRWPSRYGLFLIALTFAGFALSVCPIHAGGPGFIAATGAQHRSQAGACHPRRFPRFAR